jgi:hypothetical protein
VQDHGAQLHKLGASFQKQAVLEGSVMLYLYTLYVGRNQEFSEIYYVIKCSENLKCQRCCNNILVDVKCVEIKAPIIIVRGFCAHFP